jgi:glucosamine--fructose-6-phosphate aminotransferase (isomerizing)
VTNPVQEQTIKTNSDLMNAILSQPQLVPEVLANLRPQLSAIDTTTAQRLRKLYLTGCGDSYFAAVATELAFLQFAGLDTQPVEPLNFSRYLAPHVPAGSALVAISNSGRVSRTIESVQRVRGRLACWAVTDAPHSPLAQASDWTLSPRLSPLPSGGAGTRSYLASLLSLYLLAIHLGWLRGALNETQARELEEELEAYSLQIADTLTTAHESVRAYASNCGTDTLYFVGGGPNLASAHFGAAKVMEALSMNGVSIDLEEWAHLQFHTTGPETDYVLIAPPGAAYDRAVEQAQGIRDSEGRLLAVVDSGDQLLAGQAEAVFRVHGPAREVFSPLLYCLPLQLLAAELAIARNQSMKMRLDHRRKEVNFRQIFHSQITR